MAKIAVAPLVGAWIEIAGFNDSGEFILMSLPSWERGLKSLATYRYIPSFAVAPLVGAWIEISDRGSQE